MNSNYGKLPPQAIDFEEALLGAFLIDKDCHYLIDECESDIFYKESNQKVFKAIKQLKTDSKQIDILTVMEQLKKDGEFERVGGRKYINDLTTNVGSGLHAGEHYLTILDKYVLRESIRIGYEIQELAYDNSDIEDIEAKLTEFKQFVDSKTLTDSNGRTLYEVSKDSFKSAKERKQNTQSGVINGINTGFVDLQKITGGWQRKDLIYIGARPSMGKTAIALHFAKKSAESGMKTGFFSLEMSDISITDRAVLGDTIIDPEKWRSGYMVNSDFAQFEDRQKIIRRWPLILYDMSSIRPSQIEAICRREKFDIIFIDYLQLMRVNKGEKHQNRNSEVENISRNLKSIAKEYDMPVVCLSQLNRSLDVRGSKVPVLSDLRDSGSIEQDADIVIFPFRPNVYSNTDYGIMELHIAKHRNGRVGMVKVRHNEYINNFFDLESGFVEPEIRECEF